MYRKNKKKKKKRKKGAWGAKCVKSSRASNDPLPFPPVFRLSRVPFFAGWIDIINRNGGILGEDCPRRVEKKKKEGKTMVVKRSVVISETLDFTRGGERIAFSSTINKRRLESIVGYFSTTKETAISMRQTRRNWSPLSLQIYRFFFLEQISRLKIGDRVLSPLFFFFFFN